MAAKAHLSGKRTGCINIGFATAAGVSGLLSTFTALDYFFVSPRSDNGGMNELAYVLYALIFLASAIGYFLLNLRAIRKLL
jgi:hypothetical protein